MSRRRELRRARLVKPVQSLTIEADFWDYSGDIASMAMGYRLLKKT